jgi:hypothetical protein
VGLSPRLHAQVEVVLADHERPGRGVELVDQLGVGGVFPSNIQS